MTALVWCPFPDQASAAAVAGQLLDEGLIACANLLDGMTSLFIWQGERGQAAECGALFKTDASRLAEAVARIETLHPYDAPAVVGWLCAEAGTATRAWLAAATTPEAHG
ncbi:divalent-cation tolerance protein CutA [Altererythrobacter sp. H2]|uniref:divalent-cation tolerance protein CutA n=1 Tax=Altererythrobacter sp. H2 TaxID=3108391 RepID=UPI002B4C12D1|nr:divalent-cation tolerance protein CutA [Altererythrobacter sp. H2]WRK95908.1 divalent-cation tolerance protein CutA [Altererythrobacter sp. H2]